MNGGRAMNESKFCKEVKESLLALYPGSKLFKVHGGLYQTPGLGDLIGCIKDNVHGLYIEIETKIIKKIPKNEKSFVWKRDLFTENQKSSLRKTIKANGQAWGFIYIEPLKIIYMLDPLVPKMDEGITLENLKESIRNNYSHIIKRSPSSVIKWENLKGKIFF